MATPNISRGGAHDPPHKAIGRTQKVDRALRRTVGEPVRAASDCDRFLFHTASCDFSYHSERLSKQLKDLGELSRIHDLEVVFTLVFPEPRRRPVAHRLDAAEPGPGQPPPRPVAEPVPTARLG